MDDQTTKTQLYQDVEKHWEEAKKNRPTTDEIFERLIFIQAQLRSGADVIDNIIKRERLYQTYNILYNSLKNDKDLKN